MPKSITALFKKAPVDDPVKKEVIAGKIATLKKYGNITEVTTSIDSNMYKTLSKQYKTLVTEITDSNLLETGKAELSFELNKYQAIIAFRAKNLDDCATCLANANTANKHYTPSRLEFAKVKNIKTNEVSTVSKADFTITELEILKNECLKLKEEETVKKGTKGKVLNALDTLTTSLINDLTTAVESKLKENKCDDAIAELDYLKDHSGILQIFFLYAKSCIQKGDILGAWKYYESKLGNVETETVEMKEEIAKWYTKLAEEFYKAPNGEKYAIDANDRGILQIFFLHAKSCIEKGDIPGAWKYYESKLSDVKTETVEMKEEIAKWYTKLAKEFYKAPNGKEYATYANELAAQFTQNSKSVSPEVLAAQNELAKVEADLKKAQTNYVLTQSKTATLEMNAQLQAEYIAKIAALEAELRANKEKGENQIQAETAAKLGTIQGVEGTVAKASAPVSSPPPYDEAEMNRIANHSYLKNVTNSTPTNTGTMTTTINPNATAAKDLEQKVISLCNPEIRDGVDQAKALCDKTIKDTPDIYKDINDLEVLKFLASRYVVLKYSQEAIEVYSKIFATFGDNLDLLRFLASEFVSLKNTEKAIEVCGKIMEISDTAHMDINDNRVLNLLAKLYSDKGVYTECIKSCVKSYELGKKILSPENYQLLKQIGEKAANKDVAMEALKVAASQVTTPEQQAELCMFEAKVYWRSGEMVKFKEACLKADKHNGKAYKIIDDDAMLRSLYECLDQNTQEVVLKRACIFKLHHDNPNDLDIANKLISFAHVFVQYNNPFSHGLCLIKSYLVSHNKSLLPQIRKDLESVCSYGIKDSCYKTYDSVVNDQTRLDAHLTVCMGDMEQHQHIEYL